MTAPQPIRNRVAFEAYADLALGPDRATPADAALILHQAMQGVHAAIVGGCRIAVAFPDGRVDEGPSFGPTLRLLGSPGDVTTALAGDILRGLALARLLRAGAIRPVPSGVLNGIAYVRARPDKFLPSTWDRLDVRARARRKAGRGGLEEDDLPARRRHLAERGRLLTRLPSFMLSSASTGQRYPIYVAASARRPDPDGFTAYGLATGTGAVPVF